MSNKISGDVNGISIYFKPWTTEHCFSISVLKIHEELGGNFSSGYMKLILHDISDEESVRKITELDTGTIEISYNQSDTPVLIIPVYITTKSYFKNFLEIKFLCTSRGNDDFLVKLTSQTYTGIEDAISTYFPDYDTNLDPITDLNNLTIHQINETGINFCNRLALGWNSNTVFGYNAEGNIIFRDVSDPEKTKVKVILGKTRRFTKAPILSRSPLLDTEPINPWEKESKDIDYNLTRKDYSDVIPENIESNVYRESYNIFSKQFSPLMEAYSTNARYYKSKFYSEGELVALTYPQYRLGDILELTYEGGDIKKSDKEGEPILFTKNFLVASWDFFWTGLGAEGETDKNGAPFSVISNVYGLDKY